MSVPDAPSPLSELALRGAALIALDVAMALPVERDTGDDESGTVVDVGIDV